MEVIERRRAHQQQRTEAERAAAEHNAGIDAMEAGLRAGDRHAVSNYMNLVLRASPYPAGFPTERMTGYVPESSPLAVEWHLPPPGDRPRAQALHAHHSPQDEPPYRTRHTTTGQDRAPRLQTYDKGNDSKAKLNMGDCFAYALAKDLLFEGEDFPHTDITPAAN